jgi:hypothetical protein
MVSRDGNVTNVACSATPTRATSSSVSFDQISSQERALHTVPLDPGPRTTGSTNIWPSPPYWWNERGFLNKSLSCILSGSQLNGFQQIAVKFRKSVCTGREWTRGWPRRTYATSAPSQQPTEKTAHSLAVPVHLAYSSSCMSIKSTPWSNSEHLNLLPLPVFFFFW